MKKILTLISSVILAVSTQAQTVVDIIVNSPDHTTLEAAVIAAGLDGTLSGPGPFTVFAPTDAAFNALPAGTVTALLADIPALTNILTYHAVGASALSTSLSNGQRIVTVQGQKVTVTINGTNVYINNAKVTVADIVATNGVVHVIDAVLIPPTGTIVDVIVNSPNHNTLEAAVLAASLDGTLSQDGPFTVFAPTDAAFAALPAGTLTALLADIPALTNILTYHAAGAAAFSAGLTNGQRIVTVQGQKITVTIAGSNVYINNAKVTVADIVATNGVVHVIDAVLIPPTGTILDVVVNSPNHNTLETAVSAANLLGTLSGDGPFTLFAPTDAAFAALPAGVLNSLVANVPALTNILVYHAVSGAAFSAGLSDGQTIVTVQGQPVTVTISGGNVFINDAQVTVADIVASNGVVHVIDAVLLPDFGSVFDVISNSSVHTTLETAINAAGLASTLDGPGTFTVFAPTDAAFAAVPQATLDALLADPNGLLTDVLLHHVVGSVAYSGSLSNGQQVPTLFGDNLTVTISGPTVSIDNAVVSVTDLLANNGVVHVINAVLVPVTLSINEKAVSHFTVYPNPVVETLRINFSEIPTNATYQVFNQLGAVVNTGTFTNQTSTLDVQSLDSGIYTIRIQNNTTISTLRFVKN